MKRTLLITLASLFILMSSPVMLSAQKGKIPFKRGLKLIEKENCVKAGYKFFKAYYRGYYPGFEALAYATMSYNVDGYNSAAKICLEEAEMAAREFVSVYKHDFEGIPYDYDTVYQLEGEVLYDALYTIADTSVECKEYELADEIDILVYAAASVYCDTYENDSAIYYANIGLRHGADSDLYGIKGDAWLDLEQADSALSAYSMAHDLAPDDVFAVCGMGEAYQLRKNNSTAMEYYGKALEIEPENPYVLYCKASLLNEMFKYSEAIALFSKVIELDPSYYLCYFERAGVYFELDDYELAIADYEKYLEYEPGDEDALYNIDAAEENMWEGY